MRFVVLIAALVCVHGAVCPGAGSHTYFDLLARNCSTFTNADGGQLNIIINSIDATSLSALSNTVWDNSGGNGCLCVLNIQNNNALTSLTGLSALTAVVNGAVIVQNNSVLTSLTDLSALASVGTLTVQNNAALTSLTGLSALYR